MTISSKTLHRAYITALIRAPQPFFAVPGSCTNAVKNADWGDEARSVRVHLPFDSKHIANADVTADVQQLVPGRKRVVDQARKVAQSGEPVSEPGRHCVRPFRCEFREHCSVRAAVTGRRDMIND